MSVARWPVFICYRQSDGRQTAERLFSLLNGLSIPATASQPAGDDPPVLDVYFDQAAPGVGDWMAVHEPYLKRARAFIVVCTPGAKLVEGPQDWVHREIAWWLEHRNEPPILIDALGEGERYVPIAIAEKWPNAQRIPVLASEWARLGDEERRAVEHRTRARIIGGITQSGENIYRRELEQEQARTRELTLALAAQKKLAKRLEWAFAVMTVSFLASLVAAGFWIRQRNISEDRRISALSGQLGATSQLMVDRSYFHWETAALLTVQGLLRKPNPQLVDLGQRLAVLLLKPIRALSRPKGVEALTLSPDGTLLATAEDSGKRTVITVFAAGSGQVRAQTSIETGHVDPALRFDPTARNLIIVGSTDAFVWRWETSQALRRLPGLGQRKIVASKDGRWLAGADKDGFHLYDLSGRYKDRVIPAGDSPWMHTLLFSTREPDTLLVARDDQPGFVSLVDVKSGAVTRSFFATRRSNEINLDTPVSDFFSRGSRLVEKGVEIGEMFMTADGYLLVTEYRFVVRHEDDWQLHVWNIRGAPKRVCTIERSTQPSWKVSASGEYVAGSDDNGDVTVYELRTGRLVGSRRFDQRINDIELSADGETIAIARSGDTVVVWQWRSNQIVGRGAEETELADIALGGSRLFGLTQQGALKGWTLPDNPNRDRLWVAGPISGVAQARSADAAVVWTEAGDLLLWNPSAGRIVHRATARNIRRAELSADGRTAVVLTYSHLHVLGQRTVSIALPVEYEEASDGKGGRVRWVKNGDLPGTAGAAAFEERVPFVDLTAKNGQRGSIVRRVYWSQDVPDGWQQYDEHIAANGAFGDTVAIRQDGAELAVSILDWIVRYDVRSGRKIRQVPLGYVKTRDDNNAPFATGPAVKPITVERMHYDADHVLWVLTDNGDLWQWSEKELRWHGRRDVVAMTDRGVIVRASADSEEVTMLDGLAVKKWGKVPGHSAAVTADGTGIASIEDIRKPEVLVIGGHNPGLFAFSVARMGGESQRWTKRQGGAQFSEAAFSTDGTLVAMGDQAGAVRVWRVEDGAEVMRLSRPGAIQYLAFTFDRRALLVISEYDPGTLHIVPLNVKELISRICAAVTRDLTTTEWSDYLEGEPRRSSCGQLVRPSG